MELSNPVRSYHISDNVVYCCQYHVLFCTKWRRKVLDESIRKHLSSLIDEYQAEGNYQLLGLDISQDHVHLLLGVPPTLSVYAVVGRIKAHTSHVLRETYRTLRTRIPTLWTRVSLISTVGSVTMNDIETFLEEQRKR